MQIGFHVGLLHTQKYFNSCLVIFLVICFPNSQNQSAIKCKPVACIYSEYLIRIDKVLFTKILSLLKKFSTKIMKLEMKQCMTDLQKIMPFSFLKKIINENNEIPCFVILQNKYRFRANLNLLANRAWLPAAFIVGPLVLHRVQSTERECEKYQYNTTQLQGSKLTNAQWFKSAVDCTYRQNSFLQNYAILYIYQVLL